MSINEWAKGQNIEVALYLWFLGRPEASEVSVEELKLRLK